jgi:hypothetical protein
MVIFRRRVCWIDEAKVEEIAFLMIDIRYDFTVFTMGAKVADGFCIIITLWTRKSNEAVECLKFPRFEKSDCRCTLAVRHELVQAVHGILGLAAACS